MELLLFSDLQSFFLFLEIFIQNMQFIYTDICLNNLRYELHKLHFPNFSRLLTPPMARAQTTFYKKKKQKKKTAIFNLYLDPCHKRPEQGVVHGFEIPVS